MIEVTIHSANREDYVRFDLELFFASFPTKEAVLLAWRSTGFLFDESKVIPGIPKDGKFRREINQAYRAVRDMKAWLPGWPPATIMEEDRLPWEHWNTFDLLLAKNDCKVGSFRMEDGPEGKEYLYWSSFTWDMGGGFTITFKDHVVHKGNV